MLITSQVNGQSHVIVCCWHGSGKSRFEASDANSAMNCHRVCVAACLAEDQIQIEINCSAVFFFLFK